ncbi:hypothetical protein D0T84_21235 [Dysgonomonas sp. 521]|uniref:hypothetical protein n=1 Tax=Dysgonomonas sp. 521 TaxID=2302932 RepID=UPI0013D11B50|nr:hypothetical protein [Dysgonomonas sp. 521]NDV97401.1 hypothetical protein [Dysgonomonas sp. 521]
MNNNSTEKPETTFRDITGEWVTVNGTEFKITSGNGYCFITFFQKHKRGNTKGMAKHFVSQFSRNLFYFEMDGVYYELVYNEKERTLDLKPSFPARKKEYEFKIPQL